MGTAAGRRVVRAGAPWTWRRPAASDPSQPKATQSTSDDRRAAPSQRGCSAVRHAPGGAAGPLDTPETVTARPGRVRKPLFSRAPDSIAWTLVRSLPYSDPGRPDLRSPGRLLLWIARRQWPSLLDRHDLGHPVVRRPGPAARDDRPGHRHGRRRPRRPRAAGLGRRSSSGWRSPSRFCGIMRHRAAVANWLQAAFRMIQLLGEHAARTGEALPRQIADRRGRRHGRQRRAAGRRDVRRVRPLRRGHRVVRRGRRHPAADLGAARPARPDRRAGRHRRPRRPDRAAAPPPGGPARAGRAADDAGRGHRFGPAGAARHRRRGDLLPPVRRAVGAGAASRASGWPGCSRCSTPRTSSCPGSSSC